MLLVDDSTHDLELAELVFADHSDFTVLRTQSSSRAALDMLRAPSAELPDVVMLDVQMPGMSGLDLLQAIRAEPRLQTLPVVMLALAPSPTDVKAAYALHANSYLVKARTYEGFTRQMGHVIHYWYHSLLPRERPGTEEW
ncbi:MULTISPECIES: response regulator [Deinococcus]|uniref:Response regulator n=1 Tax=Deinococcus rufus TaxID=2136097 RepID=A0ABV7Z9C8_9DEIO|nr:response regulator [Deinococcus sp. AB2017081]WQE97336.1 response regulator [Deinococcus sp. AB2017081]